MKKRFLELLCLSAGLENIIVETYRTDGCDGAYQIMVGYIVNAKDKNGNTVVNVHTPEGFNDAVSDVLKSIHSNNNIKFTSIDSNKFKI